MDWMTLGLAVVGLAVLSFGADVLVKGASQLAQALGVSPLVVGLTIVAFGTSAPELTVSVQSALSGQAGVAIGNVVGSNILNVLFILGVSSLVAPLVVAQQLVRIDVPIMIVASVAVLLMSLDGTLGTWDGVALTAGIVAYTVFAVVQSRRESKAVKQEYDERFGDKAPPTPVRDVVYIVVGLVMLVLGSRWFVAGAVQVAQWMGVSDLVIGLTIVAAGTSLPEVAASVAASLKGERDIAVGNVIGSNIFNLLVVLGFSTLASSGGIPVPQAALSFDMPVMVAVAVACLPLFFAGHLITRWHGIAFLAYYAFYVTYLVLTAQEHELLPAYGRIMTIFVLPLTAATIALVVFRELKARRAAKVS